MKMMSKNRKSGHFFENFQFILSRDVPGQRSLSRDICSCPCPGSKGHRDKNFFLSRDKGTTGRGRPVETLLRADFLYKICTNLFGCNWSIFWILPFSFFQVIHENLACWSIGIQFSIVAQLRNRWFVLVVGIL